MPLLVVVVVGAVALLLAGRGQQTVIIGAGSTLAQPLIERSAVAFRDAQTADNPSRAGQTGDDWVLDGSGIGYEPVGSLGGILRLTDPELDFAVSDYPLSAEALAEYRVAQFPVALGAVAVVHNLDLPTDPEVRLDGPTLAQIYLGKVTRWDDPAIVALNPGVALPGMAITVVHRSDGSGTTNGFTGYLSAASTDWAAGPGSGPEIDWPTGTGAERSSGVIEAVGAVPGAIGYVEQGQARRTGLHIAALGNGAGTFVAPSTDAMLAALAGHDWSGQNDYVEPLRVADGQQAYPVTVAIYAVVKRDPAFRADTERTLRYLGFLMESYDGAAEDLGYLPLPAEGARAVQDYWATAVTPDT